MVDITPFYTRIRMPDMDLAYSRNKIVDIIPAYRKSRKRFGLSVGNCLVEYSVKMQKEVSSLATLNCKSLIRE